MQLKSVQTTVHMFSTVKPGTDKSVDDLHAFAIAIAELTFYDEGLTEDVKMLNKLCLAHDAENLKQVAEVKADCQSWLKNPRNSFFKSFTFFDTGIEFVARASANFQQVDIDTASNIDSCLLEQSVATLQWPDDKTAFETQCEEEADQAADVCLPLFEELQVLRVRQIDVYSKASEAWKKKHSKVLKAVAAHQTKYIELFESTCKDTFAVILAKWLDAWKKTKTEASAAAAAEPILAEGLAKLQQHKCLSLNLLFSEDMLAASNSGRDLRCRLVHTLKDAHPWLVAVKSQGEDGQVIDGTAQELHRVMYAIFEEEQVNLKVMGLKTAPATQAIKVIGTLLSTNAMRYISARLSPVASLFAQMKAGKQAAKTVGDLKIQAVQSLAPEFLPTLEKEFDVFDAPEPLAYFEDLDITLKVSGEKPTKISFSLAIAARHAVQLAGQYLNLKNYMTSEIARPNLNADWGAFFSSTRALGDHAIKGKEDLKSTLQFATSVEDKLLQCLQKLSKSSYATATKVLEDLTSLVVHEHSIKINEVCADGSAESLLIGKQSCDDKEYTDRLYAAFEQLNAVDITIGTLGLHCAAAAVESPRFVTENKTFLETKARIFDEDVLAGPGRLLGNITVLQAMTRDLEKGEARSSLLSRSQKFLEVRSYLTCDPKLHLLLREELKKA